MTEKNTYKVGTKVTVNGKRGEISYVRDHDYKVTDLDATDEFKQTRLEHGNYIPHNRIKVA